MVCGTAVKEHDRCPYGTGTRNRHLFNFLTDKLNVTTLDYTYDKAYSPIALGQLTQGMTLMELAGAYQIFGSGGVYYELSCTTLSPTTTIRRLSSRSLSVTE